MRAEPQFAFLDEGSKKEIRRATLKAVAIPGYQVPFASREMPMARGWGTGGLQLTCSLVGKDDVLKVIDQGADESVNAVSIKKLIRATTGIPVTERTEEATLIQSRHRIPEVPLTKEQILVLQVPTPEPLRQYEKKESVTKRLHAESEYSGAWLMLFEQIMKYGRTTTGADHPVLVNGRYVMAPSPIPRFDNPKMDHSEALILLGAGREKKIYAVPPYTDIRSLAFEDHPFEGEDFSGKSCRFCGATGVFLDELHVEETGMTEYQCNDTSHCADRLERQDEKEVQHATI
ncbi:alpha-D-ribose 1-methylphosphonate 5-phosphate C-P-lyase PhnJ [Bhargavaea beijingensis]|uniref:Alpha-D-ribose 1-methylphosphonate 5-phosphate C-P lyase n=1 Tax=Bhargavaea beijingensis TaxID=426756 RepID=A0A1G6Y1B7_9BACL|nr:alpha-D-ribose 1-methylphosphonate 5-phosphate C-P-lyase PhnJ [Bhargavaea beijingensis]MCW1927907.1 alpha-D-ribose 1-methylphosphonate 5-phosphate C-P-lyase PhnJ [Bhargavaea beijingensis]RSK25162.1 carbon-phosphorus lyase complex subunit PhnJ [Bhargavaea beijingensis]SDD83527.1 alpha-D-ribose 1-methylphosphonate 5-phosphate C-P lyase [Bhargavaea beijingensis]